MPDILDALLTRLLAGGIGQLFTYIGQMGGLAALAIVAIEYAQRAEWFPWLTEETSATAKRAVAVLAAACTAAGLSWSYDGAAEQLIFSGVSPVRIASVVVAVASQFGLQQVLFKLAKKYLNF